MTKPFDLTCKTVAGVAAAQALAVKIVSESAYFTVTPLPDDEFEFAVKVDRKDVFEDAPIAVGVSRIDPNYAPVEQTKALAQKQPLTPTSDAIKTSIQSTAMLLLDGLPYRHGEFMTELQAQMSPMERGKMFFDIRLAIRELIDEGKLVLIDFKTPQRTGQFIAPAGFTLQSEPVKQYPAIDALRALESESWLEEDPSDTESLADAKAQARAALTKLSTEQLSGVPA